MTISLEASFDKAMMDIYVRAKAEANYTASIFHRMLCERGGLATAKQLINERRPSEGYGWETAKHLISTDNSVPKIELR